MTYREMLRYLRREKDGQRVPVQICYVTSQGAMRTIEGAQLLAVDAQGGTGQFKVPGGVRRLILYTVLAVDGEEVNL